MYDQLVYTGPCQVLSADKIEVRVADGTLHIVDIEDLVKYYAYEIGSMSGLQRLGDIVADWRCMSDIVEVVHHTFNRINPVGLRSMADSYGVKL